MTETTSIRARLLERADSYDRLAGMEDHEFPEPDEFCSARGGDGSRSTASVLRDAAAALSSAEQENATYKDAFVRENAERERLFAELQRAEQENAELRRERDVLAQCNATQALTIHQKREAWWAERQRAEAAEQRLALLEAREGALRKLEAKWRRIAAQHREADSLVGDYSHRLCADELAALLASSSPTAEAKK
jgi:hypothetical protein